MQKAMIFSAVRASRGCNGAAFIMQRQPRWNVTRAQLQPREALTAKPWLFNHTSGVFPAL